MSGRSIHSPQSSPQTSQRVRAKSEDGQMHKGLFDSAKFNCEKTVCQNESAASCHRIIAMCCHIAPSSQSK